MGDERRGDDLANVTALFEMSGNDVAGGPGLVAEAQFYARMFQLLDQFVQVSELAADGAVGAEFAAVPNGDGDGDGIFVDVQTDIVDGFFMAWLFYVVVNGLVSSRDEPPARWLGPARAEQPTILQKPGALSRFLISHKVWAGMIQNA